MLKLPVVYFSRQMRYLGGFHFREEQLITKYARSPILHLFSGMSEIGETRIDLNPASKATLIMDVFTYLNQEPLNKFKTVIYDPIYSSRMAKEYSKKTGIPFDQLYFYSYFISPEIANKTKWLHKQILKISPEFIISKCWTVPPFRNKGYIAKDGIVGISGSLRPATLLIIFKRAGKQLDSWF